MPHDYARAKLLLHSNTKLNLLPFSAPNLSLHLLPATHLCSRAAAPAPSLPHPAPRSPGRWPAVPRASARSAPPRPRLRAPSSSPCVLLPCCASSCASRVDLASVTADQPHAAGERAGTTSSDTMLLQLRFWYSSGTHSILLHLS